MCCVIRLSLRDSCLYLLCLDVPIDVCGLACLRVRGSRHPHRPHICWQHEIVRSTLEFMKLAIVIVLAACTLAFPTKLRLPRRDLLDILHPAGEDNVDKAREQAKIAITAGPTRPLEVATSQKVSDAQEQASMGGLHRTFSAFSGGSTHSSATKEGVSKTSKLVATGSQSLRLAATDTATAMLNEDKPENSHGELSSWKAIGISVMCVTFLAIVGMLIAFFDTWWGFIKDVVGGCRSRKWGGQEKFVTTPDWKRGTWAVGLASEDGTSYPSLSSEETFASAKKATWGDERHGEFSLCLRGTEFDEDMVGPSGGPVTDYVAHAEMALGRNMSFRNAPHSDFRNPTW